MANELFNAAIGGAASPSAGVAIAATHMNRAFNNTLALAGGYGTQTDATNTGTSNNYSPGTAAMHTVWTGASQWNITGQVPLQNGQIQIFTNATAAQVLFFANQSGSSSAANRFQCLSASGQVVGPLGSIAWRYDGTAQRWRMIGLVPGGPIPMTLTLVSTGGGVPTYVAQTGNFIQDGNVLSIVARVTISNKNTLAAGTLTVTQPNFTFGGNYYPCNGIVIGGLVTNVSSLTLLALTGASGFDFRYFAAGGGAGVQQLTVADIGNAFDVMWNGVVQIQ